MTALAELALLDPFAAKYLEHLRKIKTPPNTIRRRAGSLRSVGRPGEVTREQLEAWWYRRAEEVSDVTRANDLANLRGFYRWCQMWEHRNDDPSVRLQRPTVQPGTPRAISARDLQTALAYAIEVEDHISRRALALGAGAGCRVSESAALMWPQVDVEHRRIHIVKSKRGKSRMAAVSTELLVMIGPPRRRCNVVTGTMDVLLVDTLRNRVNRLLDRAGVDATTHNLRHHHGTEFYRATKDLIATRDQLGHASVATTQIYTAAADDVADLGADAVMGWAPKPPPEEDPRA